MTNTTRPIIMSLLDTDLYKLSMQKIALHQFLDARVEYAFKCRTQGIDFSPYIDEIRDEIDHLCSLRFTRDELAYVSSIPFLDGDYIDFLKGFHLDRNHVTTHVKNGVLDIKIEGQWFFTILFEVPLLAIVSEVYNRNVYPDADRYDALELLEKKLDTCKGDPTIRFADFGTRRRFSREWHEEVISTIKNELGYDSFVGTSNVMFAKQFGITPIGTMAHEFLQLGQAFVPVRNSQKFMFQSWMKEYDGQLGIALTDVITTDAFLKDFDVVLARAYDGVRQDSGDPFVFGEKMINHYESLGIDPRTKTIVFSDGLNFDKIVTLHARFKDRIKVSFGIGTNLTNDFPNQKPLQIVIKMTKCNGLHVAKISDSRGKSMCQSPVYLAYLKEVFGVDDDKT